MIKWFKYLLILVFFSCSKEEEIFNVQDNLATPDWSAQTHEKLSIPAYSTVFPYNKVNRIDIVIDAENWQEMQNDLSSNLSSNQGPGQPPGETEFVPVWVPCEVFFNNLEWYKVGIRFKGNSSLRSSYQRGIKKLPLKLDFDQFEDAYPAIQNQRFYGFKQLSLKNNFEDKSFVREKVASDLFAEFGLVSPHTAFYEVYVNFGEGNTYFGLYTMVEEVDDTVIENQYENNDGNLYKPENSGASFKSGSFNYSDMNKKNNETENDYSDVEQLYDIINSSERESNPENWKNELSAVFDVPVFLKWLAANTVMQNWDTYGRMTHNYYLYHNPATDKLEWIPWDNNEALQEGKQGGALSLSLDEVNNNWPLIRYIIDQQEWKDLYQQELARFVSDVFNADRMNPVYENYRELLRDFVVGDSGELSEYSFLSGNADFDLAFDILKQHVESRNQVVQDYIQK